MADESLNLVYLVVAATIFLTFIPVEIYALCKINFRTDFTTKAILLAYTLCFAIRLTTSSICLDKTKCNEEDTYVDNLVLAMQVVSSISDRLKWLILYFFILEMQEVRIKVESETLKEFISRKKSHLILKIVLIFLFIAI